MRKNIVLVMSYSILICLNLVYIGYFNLVLSPNISLHFNILHQSIFVYAAIPLLYFLIGAIITAVLYNYAFNKVPINMKNYLVIISAIFNLVYIFMVLHMIIVQKPNSVVGIVVLNPLIFASWGVFFTLGMFKK